MGKLINAQLTALVENEDSLNGTELVQLIGIIELGRSNQVNKAREAGSNEYPGIQTTGLE
ncbi:MAG: hypothetical protein AB7K41_16215 [Bdellovibrionales bacterium]